MVARVTAAMALCGSEAPSEGLLTCGGDAVIAPTGGGGVGELLWLPLPGASGEQALSGSFALT